MTKTRKMMIGTCLTFAISMLLTATAGAQPQTSTEQTKGAPTVATKELKGVVAYVSGNDLVVKMSTGDVRTFHVPESRKFIIDGQELSVHELQPGTKLTATVTTTTTPVMVRTTTVGSGKVFFIAPPNVILTLPNGENRQYKVKDSYKFTVNGQPATVFDLRKGMTVSAEKIVEEPKSEIASDTRVMGHAPPKQVVAQAAPPSAVEAPAPAPRPAEVAAPAPRSVEVAQSQPEPLPKKLPKTASPFPLLGLLALLSLGGSLGMRMLRRS